MAQRRNGTALFTLTLLALSGTAFVAGNHLRESGKRSISNHVSSQIAQADRGRYALRTELTSARTIPAGDDADDARRTFDTIYSLVKQHFVDELPSDRVMSRGAIRSMVASLNDPNCYFLESDQFNLLNAEGRGRFGGIGAALAVRGRKQDGYTDYKIVVVAPIPGSPAYEAGLQPGDIITHIDGKWVLGYDPFLKANLLAEKVRKHQEDADNDAFRREVETARKRSQGGLSLLNAQLILHGDTHTASRLQLTGEKRTLTVERAGVKTPLVFEIKTHTVDVPSLTARTLPDGTGYIRVPLFTDQTIEDFKKALNSSAKGRGLILDLRGNPGGTRESAMAVESLLSPGNSFGFEVTTGGKQSPLKPAGNSGSARPVVVLVDRGTASVAEALAASLVDSGVGTIVGGKTFGDATVQLAYALPDGSAFVLTTGKMLSPHHTDWALTGLAPKVALAPNASEEQVIRSAMETLREHTQVASSKVN